MNFKKELIWKYVHILSSRDVVVTLFKNSDTRILLGQSLSNLLKVCVSQGSEPHKRKDQSGFKRTLVERAVWPHSTGDRDVLVV